MKSSPVGSVKEGVRQKSGGGGCWRFRSRPDGSVKEGGEEAFVGADRGGAGLVDLLGGRRRADPARSEKEERFGGSAAHTCRVSIYHTEIQRLKTTPSMSQLNIL